MEIKKICVVGGGQMGRQIALNAAINGYQVKVYDKVPAVCDAVETWEEEYLAGRIAKGRMTEEQVAQTKVRFSVVRDLKQAAADADMVIEAVVEIYDVKAEIFKELDAIVQIGRAHV